MNNWKEVQLKDIASPEGRAFAMGPFGSNIRKENYRESGVPIIRGTNLGTGRFSSEEFVFLEEDKAEELKSSWAYPQDIVFVAQGTVGKVGIIPKTLGLNKYVLSQNLMKFTCDRVKACSTFLYYYFVSHYGQHEILSYVNPTGVPCISQPLTSLKSFRIPLPSLPEQKAIANILGSLDDKIELNRRMNETLEQMARAIFKGWFVDFDPVRAKAEGRKPAGMNAETAKLFPDSFQDSELGPIPKGWKVGCIGDIAENPKRGIQPSEIEAGTPYIGLEHMPRKSLSLNEWGTVDEVASNKFKFHSGEILFGKLRPYFHKVGVAVLNGVCSTDILVIKEKILNWFSYILFCVSSNNFVDYTDAHSTGTKMPRTNWKDMSNYKVVLPPNKLVEAFGRTIAPTVIVIRSNIVQSRTLAFIRDALLPKLLSGEIRVKL